MNGIVTKILKIEKINNSFFEDIKTVVVIGFFDGVHLGHQRIIKLCTERAAKIDGSSVVFTFDKPPSNVVKRQAYKKLIVPYQEKIKILKSCGVDYIVIAGFNTGFSKLDPEEFCRHILVEKLNIKELFIGRGFRFGKNAAGNEKFLQDFFALYDVKVNVVPVFKIGRVPVSSTEIRKYYSEGNIEKITEFLGRIPAVSGKVTAGDSRGRLLGFPTANIDIFERFVIPADGVYLGWVNIPPLKTNLQAVINIGSNPTFAGNKKRIESCIIDFNKNIYGRQIKVYFLKRLRDEILFASKEDLIKQIKKDLSFAKTYFNGVTKQ